MLLNYSPSAVLNRLYALYKVKGKDVALPAALALKMENDHFYWLLLAELNTGDSGQQLEYYKKALALAKTGTEQQVIRKKMQQAG